MAQRRPHVNAAHRWARDVITGKVPACKFVIQACQRHLDDLRREKSTDFPFRFDRDKAEKVCEFAELMPHVKGKWKGTNIVLRRWQKFVLIVPFGWVRKSDGLRRFNEFYAEIPRKNSKSTLGAIVGNYMLTVDNEPGAEVYSGATTERQAMEVFRPAWQMVKDKILFRQTFNLECSGTFRNPTSIYSMFNGSRFEPLVGNPGDGPSPHCSIVDEYHEHRTSALYDSQKTGMGAREQPMLWVITTAGTDTSTPCYEKRRQALKVLSGELHNDQLFAIIFTIDETDDWTDFNVWKKANPNYGVSVFEDYLRSQHTEAMQSASKQNIIRCKHLNQWCNAGAPWMEITKWHACLDRQMHIDDFAGEDCFIGVDLASKKDITAKVSIFMREIDGEEHYFLFGQYYLPEQAAEGEDKTHYAGWAKDGFLKLTGGNMIDYSTVENDLKDDARGFNVLGVPHDPWGAAQFVSRMQDEGLEMVEIPQTFKEFSEPMKQFEALVLSGRIHHDGNPVLTWMVGNTMAKQDINDNCRPVKESKQNKIDGVVAGIMALKMWLDAEHISVYESRGVRTV